MKLWQQRFQAPWTRRSGTTSPQFFDRLDELLPAERSPGGTPSTADFLLYDLPRIRDQLANSFEGNTLPADDEPVRVWVGCGVVVANVAVFAHVAGDDAVEVISLLIS
jgi:hypothetical protein